MINQIVPAREAGMIKVIRPSIYRRPPLNPPASVLGMRADEVVICLLAAMAVGAVINPSAFCRGEAAGTRPADRATGQILDANYKYLSCSAKCSSACARIYVEPVSDQ